MFKSIFHIILAINFATATVGVTLDKHFCGKLLQKVSLIGENNTCCGMENEKGNDCCHNEHEAFQVNDEFQKTQFELKLNKPLLVSAIFYDTPHILLENFPQDAPFAKHSKYKPPLILQDYTISLQTFLI